MESGEIRKLRDDYQWLVAPVEAAVREVERSAFFSWIARIDSASEFAPVARQLFFHSATLPRAIGLMLAVTPLDRTELYELYAQHAYEEANHHLLLLEWMIERGILIERSEIYRTSPTLETSACINVAYEIALSGDHDLWLATINTALEFCFLRFFVAANARLTALGLSHPYFEAHVGADEQHSVLGLKYLRQPRGDTERHRLLVKALEGVSLWSQMAHSWLGMDGRVRYDVQGGAI